MPTTREVMNGTATRRKVAAAEAAAKTQKKKPKPKPKNAPRKYKSGTVSADFWGD